MQGEDDIVFKTKANPATGSGHALAAAVLVSEEGEEPGMESHRTAVGVHDAALLAASNDMFPEDKAVWLPDSSGAVGLRAPVPCLAGMRACKSQDLRHPVFGLASGAAACNANEKI